MNEIQIFKNEQFGEIRTLEINGQIYFVGTDVAKALGYTNPRKAIKDHVYEEDKIIFNLNTVTFRYGIQKRGNPNVIIINESGVYSLIMSSKLPDAKKFKHWVTSEVLPEIRRTGGYGNRSLSDERIYEKLEVIERKIDTLEKKVDAIEKQSSGLVKDVVDAVIEPCFKRLDNEIKKVGNTVKTSNRSIISYITKNVKLLGTYIDTLIK